jgi:miniconductance mechanosensitive channel
MNQTSDRLIYNFLIEQFNLSNSKAIYINLGINLILVLIFGYLLFKLLRYTAKKIVNRLASKTKTEFDDYLVKNNTFLHVSNLITINVVSSLLPSILKDFEHLLDEVNRAFSVIITILVVMVIRSILLTIKDFLRTINAFKDKPIESYIQVFMIIVWLISIVIIFSVITGKPLLKFLTALGAFSAVLLLVFKDTILGFVASIQVTVNDTVRIGDWITMEKYGADGDVFEINLASVKVRNFDNTITTIPTYYLISDSFKNWRGMSISGGRRIKRAILIKASSIKFLTEKEINHLEKIQLISNYVNSRHQDIKDYNTNHNIDKSLLINGRNMTNFGAFRTYVDHYLEQNKNINHEMMIMSRQLPQTAEGIPLEIYAFSKDKVWKNYERIMADIFDHLLASTHYFDLEIYEKPSVSDIKLLKSEIK